MRYELFLRRPSEPLAPEELDALREAAAREGGGGDEVQLDLYRDEEQRLLGVDLGLDLDRPDGAARLCRLAFQLAGAHRLAVYDPQLGRAVTEGDEELVQQRFDQGAAFDVAAPIATASGAQSGLSPSLKLWLAVIGLIVLVLVVGRSLSC